MTQEQAEQLKTLKGDQRWATVLYTRNLDGTILKWWLNGFIDDKVLVRNIKNYKKYYVFEKCFDIAEVFLTRGEVYK